MPKRIQVRRDTATAWSVANPVLADGEPGYEKGTGRVKYGDGETVWTELPYASPGPEGPPGPSAIIPDPDDPGFFIVGGP